MNDLLSKCYAIVPAAGRSRRMGRPKLLLPWGDGMLIDRVLQAWTSSRVERVVVIVRPDDHELRKACENWPVDIVQPTTAPVDMKASIQIGLTHLKSQFQPTSNDRWFIAPADLPTLNSQIIDQLIRADVGFSTIVLPQFGDRLGHPALLPWNLTNAVFELTADEGIDRLIARHKYFPVPFSAEEIIKDVDTPQEYQQALLANEQGQ